MLPVSAELCHAFVRGQSTPSVQGNPCLLLCLDTPPLCPPGVTGHTVCQSWVPRHEAQGTVKVVCFTPNGKKIQCCGHGLLVAANCWLEHLGCPHLYLEMNGSRIKCWQDQRRTWIRLPRIPTTSCAAPYWLSDVLKMNGLLDYVATAIAGGEQGYLIVQWRDDQRLHDLPPPGSELANRSQRALIYTAAQPALGEHTIELRYFAPQYGVDEDAATGSALRVLADFWCGRFQYLEAHQASRRGGYLLSQCGENYVDIGGYCQTGVNR